MAEIIWVSGISASGKETFIRSVMRDSLLQAKLGWGSKNISGSEVSIENIGQFDNDPVTEKRENILHEVQQKLDAGVEIIFIKWQIVDSKTHLPERLKDMFPDEYHSIIELKVPLDELVVRLKEKKWWHDIGNEEQFIYSELNTVASSMNQLVTSGFNKITINSAIGQSYKLYR